MIEFQGQLLPSWSIILLIALVITIFVPYSDQPALSIFMDSHQSHSGSYRIQKKAGSGNTGSDSKRRRLFLRPYAGYLLFKYGCMAERNGILPPV